jgi:hypothetical protein
MALTAGAVAGVLSVSWTSAAKQGCAGDVCPPSTWNDISSAHTSATVSNVAFAVAGASVAVGLVSFAFGGTSSSTHRGAGSPLGVSVWLGPGMAGLEGTL